MQACTLLVLALAGVAVAFPFSDVISNAKKAIQNQIEQGTKRHNEAIAALEERMGAAGVGLASILEKIVQKGVADLAKLNQTAEAMKADAASIIEDASSETSSTAESTTETTESNNEETDAATEETDAATEETDAAAEETDVVTEETDDSTTTENTSTTDSE